MLNYRLDEIPPPPQKPPSGDWKEPKPVAEPEEDQEQEQPEKPQ